MTLKTDVKTPTEAAVSDRRRPGRREEVNPALIPLLRTSEHPPILDETLEYDEPDQIAGARGVFFGVVLSAPLWVGIAYLGRWLLP